MYLLREEKRQREREKKKEKKDEPNGKRQRIPEHRQEGGASEREARDKARPKAWRERDEAVSSHRRREGWGSGGARENDLRVSTVFPRVTKSTVGTSPKQCQCHIWHVTQYSPPLLLPSSDACAFFFSFLIPADCFSSPSRCVGPPSRWQTRGGLSSVFYARPPCPSSAHEPEAHAGSFFFFFSFHSLTASTCSPTHSFIARRPFATRCPHRFAFAFAVSPSSCVALRRVSFAALPCGVSFAALPCRVSFAALPCRVAPSPRVAPRLASPSLRRPWSRLPLPVALSRVAPSPSPSWLRASSKCPRICGGNGGDRVRGGGGVGWMCECRQ